LFDFCDNAMVIFLIKAAPLIKGLNKVDAISIDV